MFNGHEKMISGKFRKKQMWIFRWWQFSGNHCYNPVNLIIIIARRFRQSIFLVTSFLKPLASAWNKIWRETPENRGPSAHAKYLKVKEYKAMFFYLGCFFFLFVCFFFRVWTRFWEDAPYNFYLTRASEKWLWLEDCFK